MPVFDLAQEKRDHNSFMVCGSSDVLERSLIWATDMHVLPEASSRSLLYVCKQQRLWQDCAFEQACLSLC